MNAHHRFVPVTRDIVTRDIVTRDILTRDIVTRDIVTRDRFLAPDYADGVSAPRVSSSGFPLPSPRAVSTSVHQDDGFHDHAVTVLMVAWGQFMDHDLTLTAETRSVDIFAEYCCLL